MAFIDRMVFSSSADFLFPQTDFRDAGSTDVLGAPRIGSQTGGGEFGIVPSAYAVIPITDRFTLGVSVNAPFGQSTEYDNDFIGRYEARLSELTTVNLGLSGAYRINDYLSVGGGLDLFYADTTLSSAVDFGAVCLGVLGASCFGLGLAPQQADGEVTISGDGFAVGFNLGAMVRLEKLRLGVAFRAPITTSISGDARFDVPAAAAFLTAGGAFTDTAADSELAFPASVSVGAAYDVTDRLTVLGQAIWTDWSVVDSIDVTYRNPAQPTTTLRSEYDDAIYASIGFSYRFDEMFTFRAGAAYDQTPLSDAFRTPRLPGADTYSLAAGLGVRLSERWTVDLAYQHFFFDDATADLSDPATGRLVGSFDNATDVVSLQVSFVY